MPDLTYLRVGRLRGGIRGRSRGRHCQNLGFGESYRPVRRTVFGTSMATPICNTLSGLERGFSPRLLYELHELREPRPGFYNGYLNFVSQTVCSASTGLRILDTRLRQRSSAKYMASSGHADDTEFCRRRSTGSALFSQLYQGPIALIPFDPSLTTQVFNVEAAVGLGQHGLFYEKRRQIRGGIQPGVQVSRAPNNVCGRPAREC